MEDALHRRHFVRSRQALRAGVHKKVYTLLELVLLVAHATEKSLRDEVAEPRFVERSNLAGLDPLGLPAQRPFCPGLRQLPSTNHPEERLHCPRAASAAAVRGGLSRGQNGQMHEGRQH